MSGDRILVTGGAGFIGSHLVDQLVAEGRAVTVLDDLSTGERENLAEAQARGDVRLIEGSVLRQDALDAAMEGCGAVFHMAVQSVRRSLGRPVENHEVNATGTLLTLEAARRHGIGRFVYCSSSEVYGNASDGILEEDRTVCAPVTVYGAAKLAGEHYTLAYGQTYGLSTVVVRPFNAFGPREHDRGDMAEVIPRFVIRVLNGLPPVVFGDGSQGRDFTHVTDTARGLRLAADCAALTGRTVNIGHGRLVTVREVAEAVIRACGRNDLAVDFAAPRPGDVYRLTAGTQRAAETLGFAPRVGFDDGLRDYVSWFRAHRPDPSQMLEADVANWKMPE
ncbi:NAD-dependent epimerase/dehydratase family protein [Arenibaculum pallidiluteum]|uniref:NAD-dependent epimerase/dehydratase family protein n=1 Tax=Arenibaculum pallidiluteum TaxID=2812559 RepID=UPI001A9595C2|nr:NAD-dependent epimerase/dehydratase family protein [Arenibaculum pallidiluteum]